MSELQVVPCSSFAVTHAVGAMAETDHQQGRLPVRRLWLARLGARHRIVNRHRNRRRSLSGTTKPSGLTAGAHRARRHPSRRTR